MKRLIVGATHGGILHKLDRTGFTGIKHICWAIAARPGSCEREAQGSCVPLYGTRGMVAAGAWRGALGTGLWLWCATLC